MFSADLFLWLTCYCPQSSKNDQLSHLFTITAMFIERRRITKYGGVSKWKNWWSSSPVISVPDARLFILKKKGWYSLASSHWNKGCNKNWKWLRLELKLFIFDQFCAMLTHITKILLQNLKAFVTGFLQEFSAPPKGMELMTSWKELRS